MLKHWKLILSGILLLNFLLRIIIYYSTDLFYFSDYAIYLNAVDQIHNEGNIKLVNGNFLFTISYLGYFAKYVLGNIDYFFVFNCLLGTAATFVISILTIKVTGKVIAGLITAAILTLYTEFIVFSAVFYTPVIMMFLLSLFMLFIFYYIRAETIASRTFFLILSVLVFLLSFLFKPELAFMPFILIFTGFLTYRQKEFFRKNMHLALTLSLAVLLVLVSGFYSTGEVKSNSFIFFGHTDYGGDGGEGAFIYEENEARYNAALLGYNLANNITHASQADINRFQVDEMKNFILHSPGKWIQLQFKKFFRTFGVVPETSSFKILYTGAIKERLWFSAIVVVVPVTLMILGLIMFFNIALVRKFISRNRYVSFYYLNFLAYYIFISVFLGQYQERYRLPIMAAFFIPALAFLISNYSKIQFNSRKPVFIKFSLMLGAAVIWLFQARDALNNNERVNKAIEITIEEVSKSDNFYSGS